MAKNSSQESLRTVEGKNTLPKTRQGILFKIKRWFFGMGKEFKRIKWAGRREVIEQIIIILAFWAFLALLFFLVDLLFLKTGILG
jgi:preprotein translocase subunit SecE